MRATSFFISFKRKSFLCSILLLAFVCGYAQPVARFSSTTSAGCAPILVRFTDESAGNPDYWKWDLGNGTISYLQHPSVTYFVPGNYTVKLMVRNATGADSVVQQSYVQVYAAPVVNFTASLTGGCDTVRTTFANQATGTGSWQWDFGDGVFSAENNPSHIYTQTGSYNVSLKVLNEHGCSLTLVKQSYINVYNATAGFGYNVANRCIPTKISFVNTSSGTGNLSYKWFFGNGDSSTERAPVYNYAAGGTYQVKLITTNSFGCSNTIINQVQVQNPVSAAFTADITTSCTAPAVVRFTNQLLANNMYAWSFGDTTFSTASNPVHVYGDTGIYTVKLVVRNTNGCTDSLERVRYIRVEKPSVTFDNLPDSACTGFRKTIQVSSASTDSILNYQWDFGDGGTSSEANPTHVFNGERYFDIRLITTGVSGCRDTTTMANAIRTGAKPVADFSSDIRTACSQTKIQFNNHTQGNITQWQWNFGDNGVEVIQDPLYRFSDTGYLGVELIAYNGGCTDTVTRPRYIYIKPSVSKLKFDFNCSDPFRYSFTNLAIGADSWVWNFGDGQSSTALNPVHLYSDTGTYVVSLSTYNNTTGCEGYKSKSIIATRVVPGFYASDSLVCEGSTIRFTSTTDSSRVSRFFWYFGDSTLENTLSNTVEHTYEKPGIYTVKLVVNNLVNCRDSVVKTGYIMVREVHAGFGIQMPVVCSNMPVGFTDSSYTSGGGTIRSWNWNYGDGNTESLNAAPFSHVYRTNGNYAVSLTVIDDIGCRSTAVSGIPVTVKKMYPSFWAVDSVKCVNADAKFICPFAESGITYTWDYGDGIVTNDQFSRPSHRYQQEGVYTVKLKVAHPAGCADSFTVVNAVKIEDPVAAFAISDSFRNCPPLIVQFTNQSVNAVDEVWDFGDGTNITAHNPSHFYSYPGIYTATLTVKGKGGCSSTSHRTIVVQGPKGALEYGPLNFCQAPASVTFRARTTDASNFVWDFNDGTTINSTDSVVAHQYTNGGDYLPKLMLVDNDGCRVPVQGVDTIRFAPAQAAFQLPGAGACNNGDIAFRSASISRDSIITYRWNFGDGTSAAIANPVHRYSHDGLYYPSLKITTVKGCMDSFVTASPLKVAPLPDAGIVASANSGCMPLTVSFTAAAGSNGVAVSSWQWNFGNGNLSSGQLATNQAYTAAGNYTVALTVTGVNGCQKTITKNLTVNPLPQIQVTGNKNICRNAGTTLTATGASSWLWLPAEGQSGCTNCASARVSPLTSTNYIVKGESEYGCINYDTVTVKVTQPFRLNYNSAASVCSGASVVLPVSGAEVYEWSPAASLTDSHIASPAASPVINTTYKVVGKNADGCFSDSALITVTVNALPQVNAGTDKTITAGASLELIPAVSADVTEVVWSPTGSVFRNTDNSITIKPLVTTEYTALARNAAGCTAVDKVIVTVTDQVSGNELFIPNTFSPNGDGVNDVFYPRSSITVKINRLRVMNRLGAVVYEKTNFYTNDLSAGWDGTLRGTKLPGDVYIYSVEMNEQDGKLKLIPGNVSLIR